jgi:hypothetical protein
MAGATDVIVSMEELARQGAHKGGGSARGGAGAAVRDTMPVVTVGHPSRRLGVATTCRALAEPCTGPP